MRKVSADEPETTETSQIKWMLPSACWAHSQSGEQGQQNPSPLSAGRQDLGRDLVVHAEQREKVSGVSVGVGPLPLVAKG